MIKQINRKLILPVLYGFKIYKLLNVSPFRKILCYHGVSKNPDFKLNNRHMLFSQFERELQFLKKNYEILPVNEIFRRYRENLPLKKSEVALTFDDGFLNNYLYVKPLLEKYQIPASFYILSLSTEDSTFVNWADLVDVIIYSFKDDSIVFNGETYNRSSGWQNNSGESLFGNIKKMGEGRDEAIREFSERYKSVEGLNVVSEELWKPMNKNQVVECSKLQLITIGSHTHNHFNLANISTELAKAELINSKLKLENLIQKEVNEIGYPDGSYNAIVKDLAEDAGYKYQLAVSYSDKDDINDQRILSRFSVSNSTTHEGNVIRMYLDK